MQQEGVLKHVTKENLVALRENPAKFWQGITSIGDSAFEHCTHLESIVIPEGVTHIGDKAFLACLHLQEVVLPSTLVHIGEFAFAECSALQHIILPNAVTFLGASAFSKCTNLEHIQLSSSLQHILPETFLNCEHLQSIHIPEGVVSVQRLAFSGCLQLQSYDLPSTLQRLGAWVFFRCSALKEARLPNSVTSFPANAFTECASLTNIYFHENCKKIERCAFSACKSLKDIVIPTTVQEVEEYAFFDCKHINTITIPYRFAQNLDSFIHHAHEIRFTDENGKVCLTLPNLEYREQVSFQDILQNEFPYVECLQACLPLSIVKNLQALGEQVETLKPYRNLLKHYATPQSTFYRNVILSKLGASLGLFSKKTFTYKNEQNNEVTLFYYEIAYNILQKIFLQCFPYSMLFEHFQDVSMFRVHNELIEFLMKKNHLHELLEEERVNFGFMKRVFIWFECRRSLHIAPNNQKRLPTREELRYKVLVYEKTPSGSYKTKWQEPSVANLKKDLGKQGFKGVTKETRTLANTLKHFSLYEQKHFEKAIEIDQERRERGTPNHILNVPIYETLKDAWNSFFNNYEKENGVCLMLKQKNAFKKQSEMQEQIFTFEMLSKDDPINYCIGFLTDCCATIYGTGAGALRGMIISKNLQGLVIRNYEKDIVAFALVYINFQEHYMVLNDVEINRRYIDNATSLACMFKTLQRAVCALAETYDVFVGASVQDGKPDKQLRYITCGVSRNWEGIGPWLKQCKKLQTPLKAPDLSTFGYTQRLDWAGDWHAEQYVVYEHLCIM